MIDIRTKLLLGILLSGLTACGNSPGDGDVQPTQEDLRVLPVPLSAPTAFAGNPPDLDLIRTQHPTWATTDHLIDTIDAAAPQGGRDRD